MTTKDYDVVMSVLSIRFTDDGRYQRLKDAAAASRMAMSPLAEELIDEGLRMRAHPLIVFRSGPAGRRPALTFGPEVIDVVGAIIGGDVAPEERRMRAADLLSIPLRAVDAAMEYYADHTTEIDLDMAARVQLADELEARWREGQGLIGR